MSDKLHMIELRLDPERLIRFAQDQGINRTRDQDLGYAVHAWLTALLDRCAPKPFRLFANLQRSSVRLLGYSSHSGAALKDRAGIYAHPSALAVTDSSALEQSKEMPAVWRQGQRLGFEVLACPVSRKDRQEKDVFLRRVEAASEGETIGREQVYGEWTAAQLGQSASVNDVRLQGFRLVPMLRRGQKGRSGTRMAPRITRPQALMQGALTVRDSDAFNACLARGLGRHRAFGYGMLLLRPL